MIIYQQSKSKQNLSIPIRIAKISTYSRNAVFLQNTIVVTFMSQYLAHMWSLKKHIKRIHILRAKCKQSMDRRTPLLEIIYQHITLARLWPNNYIQSMSSLAKTCLFGILVQLRIIRPFSTKFISTCDDICFFLSSSSFYILYFILSSLKNIFTKKEEEDTLLYYMN